MTDKKLTIEEMRDRIRTKTVGAVKDFKGEIIDYEGEKIEFREPSERQRSAIHDRAVKKGEVDTAEFAVWALICCTYVPETNVSVFTEADHDCLIEMPASQLDELKKVAVKYINVDREKLTKNLASTTEDTTPSNSPTN